MFEKQVIHDPKQHRAINTGQFPGQYVKGNNIVQRNIYIEIYIKKDCTNKHFHKNMVHRNIL